MLSLNLYYSVKTWKTREERRAIVAGPITCNIPTKDNCHELLPLTNQKKASMHSREPAYFGDQEQSPFAGLLGSWGADL